MKKTIWAVLAIISLVFTSCSNQDEDTIVIGAILPLTGSGSYAANYMKKGLELAAYEINNNVGNKIEIIFEDSKTQPKDGIAAYKRLRSKGVKYYVVGASNVAMAIAPLTNNQDEVIFGTAVAAAEFVKGSNRLLRVYPNTTGITKEIAKFNKEELGTSETAIIYMNNDFGSGSMEAYEAEYTQYGGKVIHKEAYAPNQKDFRSIILKLKETSPDCIYVCGYGEAYSIFVRQLFESSDMPNTKLTGDMTFSLSSTIENIGEIKKDIYYADGLITEEFKSCYDQYFHEAAHSYAGYTYIIPNILLEAINNMGTKDFNSEMLLNELKAHTFNTGMGMLSFDDDGECNLDFKIYKIDKN